MQKRQRRRSVFLPVRCVMPKLVHLRVSKSWECHLYFGSPARSVLLSGVIPVILKNDLLPRGGVPPYAPSTQALNGSGPRTTGIMRLVGRVRAGVGNQRGHTSPASASSAY